MSNAAVKKVLWWVCLVVAPLVLIGIELFHPAGFTRDPGMYQYLSVPEPHTPQHNALYYFGPQWWFAMHMIQTPMVGLVAVGLWLLVDDVDLASGQWAALSAWLARAATFVFVIYYTVLDAIGGIGLGRTIQITERLAAAPADQPHLTPDQVTGVALVLNETWTDPWVGGVGSFISQTGSWAVFFAALAAAIALLLAKKAPWPALIVLVAFGWELQLSHASFHGPIAFGLLIVAAVWIWWAGRRKIVQG
jgi:hypothetical protein